MRQPSTAPAPRPSPSHPVDVWELQRQIRRSGLSFAAQALLLAILDHDRYGQSRQGCTASLRTLAGEIGISEAHVSTLLKEIISAGWIVAHPRQGNMRPLRLKSPTPVGNFAESSQPRLGSVPNHGWDKGIGRREERRYGRSRPPP